MESPPYTAVMLCVPPVRLDVLYVAVVPLIVPVPSVVLPSLNVTVPVAPLVTVAVNVTLLPNVLGLAELPRLVVELAVVTTWVNTLLVLVA